VDGSTGLRVTLLGGFAAFRDERPVPDAAWQRPAARTLVKLLAARRGHIAHREQITEALWPEQSWDSARNSFAKTLHRARHALEPNRARGAPSRILPLHGDMVSLTDVWIDADAFEHLAEIALASREPVDVANALLSYSGELLPEDRYADWAEARRGDLTALVVQLRLLSAELHEHHQDFAASLNEFRLLLAQDPTHEEAHRGVMRTLARQGQRNAALRHYLLLRDTLRDEVGVDPAPETERLRTTIQRGGFGPPRVRGEVPEGIWRSSPGPLRGRNRELGILADHLTAAEEGTGILVLVTVEAGVGKTRLLEEAGRLAHEQGATLLWGENSVASKRTPYASLLQALDRETAGASPADRARLAHDYPVLSSLLPSLRVYAQASAEEKDRDQLLGDVVRFLAEVITSGTLLLVQDDLHLATEETIDLFFSLAGLAPERSWLLLGAYREEETEVGSALDSLAGVAVQRGVCHRLDLGRLARGGCQEIIEDILRDGAVEPNLLAHLYAQSLGNPLFLVEVTRSMEDSSGLFYEDGRWRARALSVPSLTPRIDALLQARLGQVGDHARDLAALLAGAGMDCTFAVLRAASQFLLPGMSDRALLETLHDVLKTRLVEETADAFRFRHPIFQEALYQRLNAERRAAVHAALARGLEACGTSDIELLAYHWQRAGEDLPTARYAELAGNRSAEIRAHRSAAQHFETARSALINVGAPPIDVLRLDEKIGDTYLQAGDGRLALDCFRRARTETTDAVANVRLARKEGMAWAQQGQFDRALSAYDDAEAMLEQDAESVEAAVELELARAEAHRRRGDLEGADSAARRAREMLTAHPDYLQAARAEFQRAVIMVRRGNLEAAEWLYRAGLSSAEMAGDGNGVAACLSNLGLVAHQRANFPQAEEYTRRALEMYRRRGDQYGAATCWNNLGMIAFDRHDHDRAEAYYRHGLAVRESIGDQLGIAVCCANLGEVFHKRGDMEQANDCYQRSRTLLEHVGNATTLAYVLNLLIELAEERGRSDEALEYRRQRDITRPMNATDRSIVV